MILIITNERDITSDMVILRLQEQGDSYLRVNTEDFPTRLGISWALADGHVQGEFSSQRGLVDLHTISAVWYRRPLKSKPTNSIESSAARMFAQQESDALLQNIWLTLDCLWVSSPMAIRKTEHKLYQLRLASSMGFEVPKSLVTTDPARAREFCRQVQDVIAKPIDRGYVDDPSGDDVLIYTNRLRAKDLARLDTVRFSPTFFQACIPRRCDLRVTVVGRSVFATEIHLPKDAMGEVDWRRQEVDRLRHAAHTLSPVLEHRILSFVRQFGLQFAALDFIVTPDDRYVFLEINPNGQWAWIEQLIDTPISSAIVDLLNGKAAPL